MKAIACILSILFTLTACGGGSSGGGNPDDNDPTGTVTENETSLVITGSNHTRTINSTTEKEISITGSNNTIYLQTPIASLDIVGDNNEVEISNGVTIDECLIAGNSNNAEKPDGLTLSCDISGNNNTGFN